MKKFTFTIAVLLFAFGSAFAQLPKSVSAPSMSGGSIGDLVGQFASEGLSPSAMDADFDLDSFVGKAKGVSDIASIGTHVNKLIGHIKPGMFKDGVDVPKMMDMANSTKSIADASGLLKKLNNGLLGKAFKSDWGSKSSLWETALGALK